VNESLHAALRGFLGGDAAAHDVHFPKFAARFCERDQRRIVMDDLHTAHRLADPFAVADVALNKLNVLGPGVVFPEVQDFDLLTPLCEPARNQIA